MHAYCFGEGNIFVGRGNSDRFFNYTPRPEGKLQSGNLNGSLGYLWLVEKIFFSVTQLANQKLNEGKFCRDLVKPNKFCQLSAYEPYETSVIHRSLKNETYIIIALQAFHEFTTGKFENSSAFSFFFILPRQAFRPDDVWNHSSWARQLDIWNRSLSYHCQVLLTCFEFGTAVARP